MVIKEIMIIINTHVFMILILLSLILVELEEIIWVSLEKFIPDYINRMSCPYANSLGIPKQGVHASRFMGLALNDIIATIIAAILTSFIFKIGIINSLLAWFIGGEILHYVFGTQTEVLTRLGIRVSC